MDKRPSIQYGHSGKSKECQCLSGVGYKRTLVLAIEDGCLFISSSLSSSVAKTISCKDTYNNIQSINITTNIVRDRAVTIERDLNETKDEIKTGRVKRQTLKSRHEKEL